MKLTRFKFTITHLMISVVVATATSFLIFFVLYSYPYYKILGVSNIYAILLIVDVVCGPVMTMILANPKKPNNQLFFDISIIGIIQLSALLYGIHSLYEARPVMVVFEKDRFVLVQANDVQKSDLNHTLDEFKPLKWIGTRMASIREPESQDEMLESIEASLGGVDVSLRPNWWINYDQAKPSVINRAKNITTLIDKHPEQRGLIEDKLSELNLSPEKAFYLPFVSSKNFEWTAILDNDANIIGYLNLSGF